jgi:hypothetical protein
MCILQASSSLREEGRGRCCRRGNRVNQGGIRVNLSGCFLQNSERLALGSAVLLPIASLGCFGES